jgi:hypothetical protein
VEILRLEAVTARRRGKKNGMRKGVWMLVLAMLACGALHANARASVFCAADVDFLTPWNYGTDGPANALDENLHYLYTLASDSAQRVSGHLIVVSDTKAYTVAFNDIRFVPSETDPMHFQADSAMISLPRADRIRYAWVDDVVDASGKAQSCPTFPYKVPTLGDDERRTLTASPAPLKRGEHRTFASTAADFKLDLPALDCKVPYRDASMAGQIAHESSFYDMKAGRHAKAEFRISIDSDGRAAAVDLLQPSGSTSFDAYARQQLAAVPYNPSIFRCIPVVSELRYRMEYTI